ncbi:MAG: hypothetical protein QG604_432 [Candidatus Dependentiae bacterium]|nr:hypothetical protein [Candidatus Dependentiae bacterium]
MLCMAMFIVGGVGANEISATAAPEPKVDVSLAEGVTRVEDAKDPSVVAQKRSFLGWLSHHNPFRKKGVREEKLSEDDKKKLYDLLVMKQKEVPKHGGLYYTKITMKYMYALTKWALKMLGKTVLYAACVFQMCLMFFFYSPITLLPLMVL